MRARADGRARVQSDSMNACLWNTMRGHVTAQRLRSGHCGHSLHTAIEMVRNPNAKRLFRTDQHGAVVGHPAGRVFIGNLSAVRPQGHQVSTPALRARILRRSAAV
ncbi:hypothetical protein Bcep1808_5217 [Burkholderia vietnamiensis G4]|uniref:Uncharacterized protein n=1 Tax=Burkholderia vietnamiensis (strain G4 / LMG 22486) TaxID=269482 RepID=A4JPG3_BURVG|nr:hypothetical protein Bcep1808_5217 [Burkholderia vietnamiensis G4]